MPDIGLEKQIGHYHCIRSCFRRAGSRAESRHPRIWHRRQRGGPHPLRSARALASSPDPRFQPQCGAQARRLGCRRRPLVRAMSSRCSPPMPTLSSNWSAASIPRTTGSSRALPSGKSVVTANKKLIAQHGPQLSALARKHGGALSFGASVAGGVPVIDALAGGPGRRPLYKVCGILNGTCNYILTKIEREGISFAEALAEAQRRGLCRSRPHRRRGWLRRPRQAGHPHPHRTARPSCSPSRFPAPRFAASARWISPTRTNSAAPSARSRAPSGATARSTPRCSPRWCPIDSPMAHITGSLNLVLSSGKYGGQTAFSGHGAGGHSTAVAVVSDLLDIARGRAGR